MIDESAFDLNKKYINLNIDDNAVNIGIVNNFNISMSSSFSNDDLYFPSISFDSKDISVQNNFSVISPDDSFNTEKFSNPSQNISTTPDSSIAGKSFSNTLSSLEILKSGTTYGLSWSDDDITKSVDTLRNLGIETLANVAGAGLASVTPIAQTIIEDIGFKGGAQFGMASAALPLLSISPTLGTLAASVFPFFVSSDFLKTIIEGSETGSNPFSAMYGGLSPQEIAGKVGAGILNSFLNSAGAAGEIMGTLLNQNGSLKDMESKLGNLGENIPGSDKFNSLGSTPNLNEEEGYKPYKYKNAETPVTVLISDLPDFHTNMFTLFFKINHPGEERHHLDYNDLGADDPLIDYFAIHLKGVSIPPKSLESEDINFQNIKIPKIKSEMKYDRKITLNFELDENLYILKQLSRGSYDFSLNTKIAEGGENKYLYNVFGNLTRIKPDSKHNLELIIRIDDGDCLSDEAAASNKETKFGYPGGIVFYVFQDCRFFGNKNNITMTHRDANQLEVSFDVSYKRVKKYIANRNYYTMEDHNQDDAETFISGSRGVIANPKYKDGKFFEKGLQEALTNNKNESVIKIPSISKAYDAFEISSDLKELYKNSTLELDEDDDLIDKWGKKQEELLGGLA